MEASPIPPETSSNNCRSRFNSTVFLSALYVSITGRNNSKGVEINIVALFHAIKNLDFDVILSRHYIQKNVISKNLLNKSAPKLVKS